MQLRSLDSDKEEGRAGEEERPATVPGGPEEVRRDAETEIDGTEIRLLKVGNVKDHKRAIRQ